MLSSISNRFGGANQSGSLFFSSSKINAKGADELNNNESGPSNASRLNIRITCTTVHIVCICILIIVCHIQCSEARVKAIDVDKIQYPCVCKGQFYKICPGPCRIKRPKKTLNPDPYELIPKTGPDTHGADHPDHIEDIVEDDIDDDDDLFTPPSKKVVDLPSAPSGKKVVDVPEVVDEDVSTVKEPSGEVDEVQTKYRKIYVAQRKTVEPVIHSLRLTIPVRLVEPEALSLPPPKPVFKMRKYTTYESKPEIEMVPVTTTVIKPVGVSEDQVINGGKILP